MARRNMESQHAPYPEGVGGTCQSTERSPFEPALTPVAISRTRLWQQRAATLNCLVLLAAVLSSAVLAVIFLASPAVQDRGIVIFHINWDRLLPRANIINGPPETVPHVDTQDIPKVVETAAGTAVTKAVGAASVGTSALNTIVTTVPSAIANISHSAADQLPRRIALGAQKLCTYSTSGKSDCRSLRESPSQMLPDDIPPALTDFLNALGDLQGSIQAAGQTARGAMAAGIALSLLVGISVLILSWRPLRGYRWQKAAALGIFSLICLLCFLIPTGIIFTLQSQAQQIAGENQKVVGEVESGLAGRYSLGAACCLVVVFGCSLGWAMCDRGE